MINRFTYSFAFFCLLALVSCHPASRKKLTDYVNPMLGTATPVTQYHSGSGYQYEDSTICAFAVSFKELK